MPEGKICFKFDGDGICAAVTRVKAIFSSSTELLDLPDGYALFPNFRQQNQIWPKYFLTASIPIVRHFVARESLLDARNHCGSGEGEMRVTL